MDECVVSGDAQLDLSDVMKWARRSLTTIDQSAVAIVTISPVGYGMQLKHSDHFFSMIAKKT